MLLLFVDLRHNPQGPSVLPAWVASLAAPPGMSAGQRWRQSAVIPDPRKPAPARSSDLWQHAGEDLEAEVLLISKSVGPSLDDADLVVDPFDEAQRHLVLLIAIRRDPVPVLFDHPGELFVWLEALPPQGRLPTL